ncbi:heme A synthase [Flavobacterium sp. CS20]|jgi:cytochrome c oxidase assembly protein subunit 15|uniref:COX15/CtaA family protein n=1 Tax=Flavobacterium sp. CS20 TaxID=2775246 RepID=UPI001B39CFA4|nr:COX15/CtaA family protein [Flavobacterium sp. CS20]QTY27517.1 COX15/CtaA family protein [Flavobacterium sp. CS20]
MFRRFAKISLIAIYLVIIAGAVVRMTGSGMGCPDWPKCFGYYIPPTEREQLEWKPQHNYFKGQVIIVNESLKVAKNKFSSNQNFNQNNWNNYNKHDYAKFNVWHTWIEYINRLFGALSGVFVLLMFISSFWLRKSKPKLILWSFITLVLLLFQAWLGATVVYSNLLPARITIHMIVALTIVALLLYIIHISKSENDQIKTSSNFKFLVIFSLILSLIQIGLGTQVRQFVDETVKSVGYEQKELWLNNPDIKFYIHRTFSIVVLLVNVLIWFMNRKYSYNLDKLTNGLLTVIGIEILTGILMYYFDFPFLTQPFHLVIATLMFSLQFYIFVKIHKNSKKIQTI